MSIKLRSGGHWLINARLCSLLAAGRATNVLFVFTQVSTSDRILGALINVSLIESLSIRSRYWAPSARWLVCRSVGWLVDCARVCARCSACRGLVGMSLCTGGGGKACLGQQERG